MATETGKFYPEPSKMPLKVKSPVEKMNTQKPEIVRGTGHGQERKIKKG